MKQTKKEFILGLTIIITLTLLIMLIFLVMFNKSSNSKLKQTKDRRISSTSTTRTSSSSHDQKIVEKSLEKKKMVMEQDMELMNAYRLYYDYAHLSLKEVVLAYMSEYGIEKNSVAFSYKNLKTGQRDAMNDTQAMTAGSTYKLPLNMLVVDAVVKGKLSMEERFDITETDYEYIGEHNNYVAAFSGAMSIDDMQKYSLVYSENTPAYALAERIGGMDSAYSKFGRYGQSKGDIKNIQKNGNKVTTDYYIQVLDYLWKHRKKYDSLITYLEESFPTDYYRALIPSDVVVAQKPGYVREALNVGAIVKEEVPYIVAIYTAGLGGSTQEDSEINGVGLYQLEQLCFVINQWHRVNMN
ncbi:TPA: serine hydrolase [Streptococcus agalactiae]|nr:serine hydrolase [Streptococcus agalactiae]